MTDADGAELAEDCAAFHRGVAAALRMLRRETPLAAGSIAAIERLQAACSPGVRMSDMREAAAKVAEGCCAFRVAEKIRALPIPYPDTVRDALTKAAVVFREKARRYQQQIDDNYVEQTLDEHGRRLFALATRNRELAELMEAALRLTGGEG
jgi:hypothetical protein